MATTWLVYIFSYGGKQGSFYSEYLLISFLPTTCITNPEKNRYVVVLKILLYFICEKKNLVKIAYTAWPNG